MGNFTKGAFSGFFFGVGLAKLIDVALIYYTPTEIIINFGVPVFFILGLVTVIIIAILKKKGKENESGFKTNRKAS